MSKLSDICSLLKPDGFYWIGEWFWGLFSLWYLWLLFRDIWTERK